MSPTTEAMFLIGILSFGLGFVAGSLDVYRQMRRLLKEKAEANK